MATRKPPDSEAGESPQAMPAAADDWIRQFVKHLEWQFVDASCELPPNATVSDLRAATARAIVATFVDSGLEFEAILELFGQVAVDRRSADIAWSDALNQRRLALIDREIQGELTSAERIELVGLTSIMRQQIDSEANLPLEGAQALHRKLLQTEPKGESA